MAHLLSGLCLGLALASGLAGAPAFAAPSCAPGAQIRTDRSCLVPINLTGSLQNPAFSPSGSELVFTRYRNGYNSGPADLYVVQVATGAVRPLVSDGSVNVNSNG